MAAVGKVDTIVDFAAYLQGSLLNRKQPVEGLSTYVKLLPLCQKDLSPSDRTKLNQQGVALWNICGRLRQSEQLLAWKELLSQARAFAYLLLESASGADTGLLENALKVAKECLDTKLLNQALQILERTAILLDSLSASTIHHAEYLQLRIALAWRQERPDLAEHFFTKLQPEVARLTTIISRGYVDLFFKIGRDYLDNGHGPVAAMWLERATTMFGRVDISDPDISNLRLNVLHTYARALLRLEDADGALLRAQTILETLQQLYKDNTAVLLLQLEVAARGGVIAYSAGIEAFSRSQLTQLHYQVIIHHIHCLRKLDPEHGRQSLQNYLVDRLAIHSSDRWVESALIKLVWMSTSSERTSGITSLETTFAELHQRWTKSLSTKATNGIVVFLWRRIEKEFNEEEYENAAAWCKLAMHQLLSEIMGDLNAGKIQRKLLQCLSKQSKLGDAREIALKMSLNVARHPFSLYLTYCIAIRLGDEDLAQFILKQTNSDGVLLACACETLRHELGGAHSVEETCTRICNVFETVAKRMHKSSSFSLIEKNWFTKTLTDLAGRFHKKWPTQSTIQLLNHTATLSDICADVSFANGDRPLLEELSKRHGHSLFALAILYTREVRFAKSAEARVRNYTSAREFAHLFDQHLNLVARPKDLYIGPKSSPSKEYNSQLGSQQITLLPIKLEAALHIPEKDSTHDTKVVKISEVVAEAVQLNAPARVYTIFIDIILSAISKGDDNTNSEALISVNTAVRLVHDLSEAAQETEGYSVLQASRWIRCLVQLVVAGSEERIDDENMKLMEEIVDKALVLAAPDRSQGDEQEKDQGGDTEILGAERCAVYPAEELEWLATTLFNLAVDYYVDEKEEPGKKWARKAAELADVLRTYRDGDGDGGLLARVLREKMAELGWSLSVVQSGNVN